MVIHMTRYFRLLLWLAALSFGFDTAWATQIQASLVRNPVAVGETFQIVFTADGEPDQAPDFTPLALDFDVLGQQRSSNTSLVNGSISRKEQWILRLLAKHSGDILIPPIRFGSDNSQPLSIKVTDAAASAPQDTAELFVEVEVTPAKPFVQSQVLYTVRVYRRVELVSARLSEPELKDAIVEKLGEDAQYAKFINGMDYIVIERKYAIFPQQSGQQTIEPLTLNAEVMGAQNGGFDSFFGRSQTQPKTIKSKAVTLDVQPLPPEFNNSNWLSAESLQLQDSWAGSALQQAQVGEPITRTLRLSAQGTTVAELPDLNDADAIDGLKTYPDQPLLNEEKQPGGLSAVREEKIAYIASKPGRYNLPAREIKWFNIAKQKVETLKIAAITINVTGSADSGAIVSAAPEPQQAANNGTPAATAAPNPAAVQELLLWQIACVLVSLAWLLSLFWVWRLKQAAPATPSAQSNAAAPMPKIDKVVKRLKAACIANQAQAAKQALLIWSTQQLGIDNLTQLAAVSDATLAEQIRVLNQQLYAQQAGQWDGYPLWQAFEHHKPGKQQAAATDGLEPLHKL
jgi:BatD DUF11 like domain